MRIVCKHLGIKSATVKGNEFEAMISTDTLDRDGEVLLPGGCSHAEYEKNPILLWMHDADKPIGTGSPGATVRRKGGGLSMRYTIPERPADYKGDFLPEYAAALVAAGVLRTVSVRFMPIPNGQYPGHRSPSQKDRETWGPDLTRVYTDWKLLEVSLVSIPSNPDAMIQAVHKHIVTDSAAKQWGGLPADWVRPAASPAKRRVVVTVPACGSEAYANAIECAALKRIGRLYGPK